MTTLRISNRQARWLWLDAQGLSETPTGPLDLTEIIRKLGFVQLDTIQNVVRAHHHILWSRNQNYREPMLGKLYTGQRTVFEHFTHDASIIPIEFYPKWSRQFRRLGERTSRSDWYKHPLNQKEVVAIKQRIADEGPLSTHAFDTKIEGKKEMWARPPHKKALDHMWYAGELSTSHRENFVKYYDLTERVIPTRFRDSESDDALDIDWLCRNALDRLGFGSQGDVQRFWAAMDAKEAKFWVESNKKNLISLSIDASDRRTFEVFAHDDIEQRLARLKKPSSRLRILNPFDPVVRDRDRLQRLFGFEYRNEMFVPPAKRKWGYYVYPLLEADRIVGRVELKGDRNAGQLIVHNIWQESKVRWSRKRQEKLEAELQRFGRLAGLDETVWNCAIPTLHS
ncbi:MAG: crosslink repair DNA glycosylase YcaQ family protein [Parasphingorhabdus sp.]